MLAVLNLSSHARRHDSSNALGPDFTDLVDIGVPHQTRKDEVGAIQLDKGDRLDNQQERLVIHFDRKNIGETCGLRNVSSSRPGQWHPGSIGFPPMFA
jgi:hypothetical protein